MPQSCHRPACFAKVSNGRQNNWMEDLDFKEELQKYVRQGLKRDEILNFMEQDFGDYAWSLRTLDRRMRHFDIRYMNTDVMVDEVKSAVLKELDGPGKLLGLPSHAQQDKARISTKRSKEFGTCCNV